MLVAETVGSPQARSNGPGCGVSGVPVGPWLFLMTGGSPATWSLAAEQSGDPCREHCSSGWTRQGGSLGWQFGQGCSHSWPLCLAPPTPFYSIPSSFWLR